MVQELVDEYIASTTPEYISRGMPKVLVSGNYATLTCVYSQLCGSCTIIMDGGWCNHASAVDFAFCRKFAVLKTGEGNIWPVRPNYLCFVIMQSDGASKP